jgi:hypothetical protein
MPWTKKIMNAEQAKEILSKARAGDILVVRAGGYLSSILLGEFSHVAFILNQSDILDSTEIGVARRSILSCIIGYTRVVIVRPKFTTYEKRKSMERAKEIEAADIEENIKYNFSLVEGNDIGVEVPRKLTCSQLVRDIMNTAKPDYLDLRKRLGFMSITPEDFYKAKTKFDLVYDSEK